MSLLVTGGAGFIGSHLIERLLADRGDVEIVCLDNFNDYYDPALKRANVARLVRDKRVIVVEESIANVPVISRLLAQYRVRQVVHLAAYAGVRASISNPLVYEEANVRGTLALLEATRACRLDRFVLVSSSTVYGRGTAVPFREDDPLGTPMSPYGATKRAAELLGQTYHHLHAVPVVCLRPFNVYGPRMRPDLAMRVFAEAIIDGRPLPLYGDGRVCRDFTHVSDICTGLLAALEAPAVVGEAINLGHNDPIAIGQLISMLEEALGRKAIVERREGLAGDMPATFAEMTKARRLLAYEPKVALPDGIADLAAWLCQTRGTS